MKALIIIFQSYVGDKKKMRNLDDEIDNSSEKRNNDGDLTDNIINYGKHILPVLVFIVIGILCIPGWIICCFCCCCNCCCCCCCKKQKCKIPCFIISYVMYALVVAVCFYGLSQSNHIFVGLADTECSILRFIDEILEGESKDTTPKWAGINGIKRILNDLDNKLDTMKETTNTNLGNALIAIEDKDNENAGTKKNFLDAFETFSDSCNTYVEGKFLKTYSKEFSYSYANGKYALDLVKNFGEYDREHNEASPPDSYAFYWLKEFKTIANNADEKMQSAKEGFENI